MFDTIQGVNMFVSFKVVDDVTLIGHVQGEYKCLVFK